VKKEPRPAKTNERSDVGTGTSSGPPGERRLQPQEWNFDGVEEAELGVCRLWEYARESAWIREISRQSSLIAGDRTVSREKRETVRRPFYQLFGALGRASILFQNGVYGFGGATKHYQGFESPFPQPWQASSGEQRRILMETAEWNARDICPASGFRRAQFAYIDALCKRFTPKGIREVFGDRRPGVAEFDHAGGKLRAICPNFMYADGTEILLGEIKWGEFTNEQLAQAFSEWLKENEPEGIRRPVRRPGRLSGIASGTKNAGERSRCFTSCSLSCPVARSPRPWRQRGAEASRRQKK